MCYKLIAVPFVSIYTIGTGSHPDRSIRSILSDNTKGLMVHRNLLKPLNHLQLLEEKQRILKHLELTKSIDPDTYELKLNILQDHQQGRIPTQFAVKKLIQLMVHPLSETNFYDGLFQYAKLGHMEFHPSDDCNLTCRGCTYGHDYSESRLPKIFFPFDVLARLTSFNPKSIVLVGGGEPTLYRDGKIRFQGLITRLKELLPNTKLGLISNGTFIPKGDWIKELRWIRLSVDASTSMVYKQFRGKPFFHRVIDNFFTYLNIHPRSVGLSFLYSKINIQDYVRFADFILEEIMKRDPAAINKVSLHYRPLRQDPKDVRPDFPMGLDADDIRTTSHQLKQLILAKPHLVPFLRDQTNIEAFLGGNTQPPQDFSACHYSQIAHIVRAAGTIRPCFVRVVETEFDLGNIAYDPLEKIMLNIIYANAARDHLCTVGNCRQSHINHILDEGLSGRMAPSSNPVIVNDPFI